MSAAPESIRRETLEQLQTELSSRKSTLYFAQAGVSSVFAFILFGAAMKLVWDAKQAWSVPIVVFTVAMGIVAYAVVRLLDGRRALRLEAKRFEEMLALRRELKLDDPAALLPLQ